MTVSDMIDDVANHSITLHLLPLIIGIVLIGVSASFGLKKRERQRLKVLSYLKDSYPDETMMEFLKRKKDE